MESIFSPRGTLDKKQYWRQISIVLGSLLLSSIMLRVIEKGWDVLLISASFPWTWLMAITFRSIFYVIANGFGFLINCIFYIFEGRMSSFFFDNNISSYISLVIFIVFTYTFITTLLKRFRSIGHTGWILLACILGVFFLIVLGLFFGVVARHSTTFVPEVLLGLGLASPLLLVIYAGVRNTKFLS